MALFGTTAPTSLEQVLGNQANSQVSGIEDAYAQKKKRLVSQEAHSGRLMSGVSDYPLADLSAAQAGDEGDVYANLAGALGQIPAEDQLNQDDYNHNLQLADLIGKLNRPSELQQALGALKGIGGIAGTAAAFG